MKTQTERIGSSGVPIDQQHNTSFVVLAYESEAPREFSEDGQPRSSATMRFPTETTKHNGTVGNAMKLLRAPGRRRQLVSRGKHRRIPRGGTTV